jgi:hypothetical protein
MSREIRVISCRRFVSSSAATRSATPAWRRSSNTCDTCRVLLVVCACHSHSTGLRVELGPAASRYARARRHRHFAQGGGCRCAVSVRCVVACVCAVTECDLISQVGVETEAAEEADTQRQRAHARALLRVLCDVRRRRYLPTSLPTRCLTSVKPRAASRTSIW